MAGISIIPAVLPQDYADLVSKLGHIRGTERLVQIDVCDGQFVNSVTFPFSRGDDAYWTRIVHEDEGLPLWQEFDFEVDLMVKEPAIMARQWFQAGATRIILHVGSTKNLIPLIEELAPLVEVGIALPSSVEVEEYTEALAKVAFVQVMGISRIGFQGEAFDKRCLETISSVRALYPALPIHVDGGVSPDTVALLVKAGATHLISGSFILSSVYPVAAIEELKTRATKGLSS